MIRDIIKEVKPDQVLVELCQDRYDNWMFEIVSHPNYDKQMDVLHKMLDKNLIERVAEGNHMDVEKSYMEMLVGTDIC